MKRMYLETEVVALDVFEPGMCGSMCGFWDNTKCLCKIGFDGPVCPLKELPESRSDSAINTLINMVKERDETIERAHSACEALKEELRKAQERLKEMSEAKVSTCQDETNENNTVENFLSEENHVEKINEKAEQGERDPNSPWFAADTPEERSKRRRERIKELGLEEYDGPQPRVSAWYKTKAEVLERFHALREQVAKDTAKDKEREEKTDGSN